MSLDVRYIVFFYNYTFCERDDVGACCNIALGVDCNTVTVEQTVRIFAVIRDNNIIVIQAPKLASDIYIVVKSIL